MADFKNISSSTKFSKSPPAPPPPPKKPAFDDDEYINCGSLHSEDKKGCDDYEDNWDDDEDEESDVQISPAPESRRGSESQNGNRYFKERGADTYLFSSIDPTPSSEKSVVIVNSPDGPIWKPLEDSYTCAVTDPKRESKLAGMKKFITYQLTPTFSNIQVSRRYKHFTWLYQRLTEKFTTVSIPPVPEKSQLMGKFEEDFISGRLRLLQLWVLRMCKHPVVSHADVFLHFLTCTDDRKWTQGKRVAEKDEFVHGRWFSTVQAPALNTQEPEKIDKFSQFVKNMDESLRQMTNVCEQNTKKHEVFMKEYQRVGSSFSLLAKSFVLDERQSSVQLTKAIEQTSQTYDEIGLLFGKQPSVDMYYLLEGIQVYRGILTTFPSTIAIHKELVAKVKEKEDKLSGSEFQSVQQRAGVITATVLANMLYFQQERVNDFKDYMSHYLEKQIELHTTITAKLCQSLEQYRKL